MTSGIDAELAGMFRDEATERLDQMDTTLLAVESGAAGAEVADGLFRHVHTVKGAASLLGFDDIRIVAHAVEDVLAEVRTAAVFPPQLAAPLIRATAVLRAQVAGVDEPFHNLLADLAASRSALPAGREAQQPPAGPPPSREAPRGEAPVNEAPDGEAPDHEAAAPRTGRRTLRVPAEKIDRLLDAVGEVMQYQGQLIHTLGGQHQLPPGVADVMDGGERMLTELKDTAIGMRTLPLSVISRRLPVAVRDMARQAGKDVGFAVHGADTELDRVILETLHDPLAHLLSNAVIHGIEPAAERAQAGKPARGRLEVRAVPHGSLVEIVVADDGRGVSADVLEQARRGSGLTGVLTRAGYSTAAEVTDLAGRGVGLDAVSSYVRSLGGSLDVRSEPGRGMEVVLLLPLALAILEVLLFERGAAVYGVPLSAVEEVVVITRTMTLDGRPSVDLRGQPLPVADAAALIGAAAPPLPGEPPALVISADGRRAVATCDAVLGQRETVVKPLGPLFGGTGGYLGASILGDGRIALLIEPAVLTRGPRHTLMPSALPSEEPAAAPRILVVEDSFTVRELQRSILEAGGYPVTTARDGRDALSMLHRDPGIALVVTDLDMPELSGLELTRAIRADPARSSLPVVIVTSNGSEDDRRRGIEAGADAYMAKHAFDQHTLLATVERLVGR
ncbi:MAG: response regulator [Actinomycetota bacterium]